MTNQPPLSSIVKSGHLSFSGHLVRMDENADASQVSFEPPRESWRRRHTTWMKTIEGNLSCLDLELHEARELAQNRPLWRLMSLYSAMHSQWCMLLLDWLWLGGRKDSWSHCFKKSPSFSGTKYSICICCVCTEEADTLLLLGMLHSSLIHSFLSSYFTFSPKFALIPPRSKQARSTWNFNTKCRMVTVCGWLLFGNVTYFTGVLGQLSNIPLAPECPNVRN